VVSTLRGGCPRRGILECSADKVAFSRVVNHCRTREERRAGEGLCCTSTGAVLCIFDLLEAPPAPDVLLEETSLPLSFALSCTSETAA
jgi:hypothetical protein